MPNAAKPSVSTTLRIVEDVSTEEVSLSSKILSSAGRILKTRKISFYGFLIEIRQPTVSDYLIGMDIFSVDDQTTNVKFLTIIMLNHCYVPGTEQPVFNKEDVEHFLKTPFTNEVFKISNAYNSMIEGGST